MAADLVDLPTMDQNSNKNNTITREFSNPVLHPAVSGAVDRLNAWLAI